MRIGLTPEDLAASERLADTWPTPGAARPRLYGIGTGKSGTNALASLFTGIPTAHEPEPEPVIHAVLDYAAGRSDWRSLRKLVLDRDRRLALSVDVANLSKRRGSTRWPVICPTGTPMCRRRLRRCLLTVC